MSLFTLSSSGGASCGDYDSGGKINASCERTSGGEGKAGWDTEVMSTSFKFLYHVGLGVHLRQF